MPKRSRIAAVGTILLVLCLSSCIWVERQYIEQASLSEFVLGNWESVVSRRYSDDKAVHILRFHFVDENTLVLEHYYPTGARRNLRKEYQYELYEDEKILLIIGSSLEEAHRIELMPEGDLLSMLWVGRTFNGLNLEFHRYVPWFRYASIAAQVTAVAAIISWVRKRYLQSGP